jgi:hypothetical protein
LISEQPLELRLRRLHQRHRQALIRRIVTAGIWSAVLLGMATIVVGMTYGFLQK